MPAVTCARVVWRRWCTRLTACSRRCLATVVAPAPEQQAIQKSFRDIMREMQDRVPPIPITRKETFDQKKWAVSSKVTIRDLRQGISLGDLVVLPSGPAVIVKLPSEPSQPFLAADNVGVLREVTTANVDCRLGNLIPANVLAVHDFQASDRIASAELYSLIAFPLRSFYERALKESSTLINVLRDVLSLYQKRMHPVTLNFFDLLAVVDHWRKDPAQGLVQAPEPRENGQLPQFPERGDVAPHSFAPEFIYAVQLALGHYTLSNKVRQEFKYLSNYSLTILPVEIERRNVRLITRCTTYKRSTKVKEDFVMYVKDYALGNLPSGSPQADGIALQILRSKTSEDTLTRGSGASYAHKYERLNLEGPAIDKYSYQYFINPYHKPALWESGVAGLTSVDNLGERRSNFDETVYCVDSPDTFEVDDGFSISIEGSVAKVGIHIVNPTSYFTDPRPLLQAIYALPSTAYLPTRAMPMLPREFIELLSFRAGNPSRSLSLVSEFSLTDKKWLSSEIKPLRLTNITRKTYSDMNEILANAGPNDPLSALAGIAKSLKVQRIADGGAFTTLWGGAPQVKVKNNSIGFVHQGADSRAVELVTELMIHANNKAAEYLSRHNIPALYRTQELLFANPKFRDVFRSVTAKKEPVSFEWQSSLTRARLGVLPSPHESLGLSQYTYFTSPLRRGIDIIGHAQIEAHMLAKDTFPLTRSQLEVMVPWLETSQGLMKECQRLVGRFWTLKYLLDQNIAQVDGIVSRVRDESAVVYLPKWGISAELPSTQLSVNEQRKFRISKLSAIADALEVAPL